MALVLVLGMLVLVAVLVVAFLSSVSTELQSAKSYAGGSDARALADSAVNVVIAQIQEATTQPRLAWASQPGMIRTYDSTGNATKSYKLYSSGDLQPAGNFDALASTNVEVPANWASLPSIYTDLNEPISSAGVYYYPIISPAAVSRDASLQPGDVALDGTSTPIEGCFIDTTNPTAAAQPTHVPMPVQWLYVLKDGSLAAMDTATNKIQISPATLADGTSNSVVGRVAFWTDDDSCKVNVNTASEGTFWDRPWTASATTDYEMTLAKTMPAQNEFQRFPGHPAMTCLSTIFPRSVGESIVDYNRRIYGMIPRVKEGGSNSGTATVNVSTAQIVPDNDRLFASVDEFMFSAAAAVAGARQLNTKGPADPLTDVDLEKTRFFLTSSSRSPDVNLFNKPRITLWPLQLDPEPVRGNATRNSKDKLISFCSMIGDKPYYFQRFNTYDYTLGGPNDPGTNGPFKALQSPGPSSQSPTADWVQIPRNQEIYAYLQDLTSLPVPGFGGAFSGSSGKYTVSNRDQILTEMFDFLRSNINITTSGIATGNGPTTGYSYAPFNAKSNGGAFPGQFQVVPLVLPNGTKGFGGQFPTVTQAALIFYRKDKLPEPTTNPSTGNITYVEGEIPGPYKIGVALILQPYTPTPGPPAWSSNVRYAVRGLKDLKLNGISLNFPEVVTNLVTGRDGEHNASALTGLELNTQYYPHRSKKLGPTSLGAPDEEHYYPFITEITLPHDPTNTFDFSGGLVTVETFPGYAKSLDPAERVQTIEMNFPKADDLPIPSVDYKVTNNNKPTATRNDDSEYTDFELRLGQTLDTTGKWATPSSGLGVQRDGQHNPLPLIRCGSISGNLWYGDTVRSVEARSAPATSNPASNPTGGDYRVIAALKDVPGNFFEGHGEIDPPADGMKYTDKVRPSRVIHSLRVDAGSGPNSTGTANGFYRLSGNPHGKLIAPAKYYTAAGSKKGNREPAAPRGLVEARMRNGALGDWDTGVGSQRDGAYINKPDLGNLGSNTTITNGYYFAVGIDRSAADAVLTDTGASFSPNRQISSAVAFGSLPSGIDPANTGVTKPWQTLLFCKNPLGGARHPGFGISAGGNNLPPYTVPPDHLFLDLFTMPIVEPYAISEPFSTAGKVNMNYQIVPFTYLTRSTAVRSVLKSTNIMAIPTNTAPTYKANGGNANPAPPDSRYTLNPDESEGTLAGFEQRFQAGDVFRSASEICDIWLVPDKNVNGAAAPGNPKYQTMESWWHGASDSTEDGYKLTGDNVREYPYGHLYPRLTTKSNTYTVHVRVQSLKKASRTPADQFVDGIDTVSGEYRGSFVIQRALDPNSDSLVKLKASLDPEDPPEWEPATETDPEGMVGPYKFRILSSKRFAP